MPRSLQPLLQAFITNKAGGVFHRGNQRPFRCSAPAAGSGGHERLPVPPAGLPLLRGGDVPAFSSGGWVAHLAQNSCRQPLTITTGTTGSQRFPGAVPSIIPFYPPHGPAETALKMAAYRSRQTWRSLIIHLCLNLPFAGRDDAVVDGDFTVVPQPGALLQIQLRGEGLEDASLETRAARHLRRFIVHGKAADNRSRCG